MADLTEIQSAQAIKIIGTDTTGLETNPVNASVSGLRVDGSAVTQPVSGTVTANAGTGTFAISAVALPLPTGAATSALQTTGNTSLSSIDGKTPALGQALAAASVPVVLTAAQMTTLTPLTTVTVTQSTAANLNATVTGTVAATQSGTWNITNITGTVSLPTGASTSALQTTGNTSLSSIDGKLNSLGQKTSSASVPVVIASDQSILTTVVKQEPNYQIALGNGYVTQNTTALTINSTETNAVYLKNNSLTKTVYLFNVFCIQDPTNANNYFIFRAYYNPTVTANGTAATISNMLAGSGNTSSSNVFTGSTTSSHGVLQKLWTSGLNNASSPLQDVLFANYYILPPSQSLLITGQAKANSQGMYATLMWFEV